MKKLIILLIFGFMFIPKSFADFWDNLDDEARELVFPDEFHYNAGVESFKNEEYLDAVENFLSINCEDKKTELCFKTNHNLGNSLYYFSFEVSDEVKVKNYEKAIKAYEKALEIKDDPETRANKEFVEDKLKKLKEKLEKQEINIQQKSSSGGKDNQKNNSGNNSQNNQQNNNQQQQNQNNNQQQQNQNNNNQEQNQNQPNQSQNQTGKGDDSPVEEVPDYVNKDRIGQDLTDSEKQSMDSRLDYLLKDSGINSESFDKKKDPNEDIRNRLFGDFQNEFGFGMQYDQEKDW